LLGTEMTGSDGGGLFDYYYIFVRLDLFFTNS
jgi:hypothetical protein